MTFNARYMFLEPMPEDVEAESAREAAAAFLEHRGGMGKGNFGRCVIVTDETGSATTWAFIRTSYESGKLCQTDERGFVIGGESQ